MVFFSCFRDGHKTDCLCDLYQDISISQAVIFANTQVTVERLFRDLTERDFTVSYIHGGMDQQERALRMKEFKAGASRIMISTDLLVTSCLFC